MTRNQYNLYISNISERTDEEYLISYFSQFGKIESFTLFPKTTRRTSISAMITYGLTVDLNQIIRENQRVCIDGQHLFLRRTLPLIRPAYERFMSSNLLLVSLTSSFHDQQFNEMNIRKYFCKYGSIVSCRVVIRDTTFLIDFVETNSVDWAILAEPHFYNEQEMILRKYVSPKRIVFFRTQHFLYDEIYCKMRFSYYERIRRLEHIMEAFQFGQRVELKLIKSSFQEKMIKDNEEKGKLINQCREKCDHLKEDMQRMNEQNSSVKLIIEENQRMEKDLIDVYQRKIANEKIRRNELKKAMEILSF